MERTEPGPASASSGRTAEPPDPTDPIDPMDPMNEIVDRVRDITRANEKLFARLIEGERRFRGLAKAVWKVQEEEQRRIARELHDGLGQTLTALTHQLERLRKKCASELAPELASHLQESVEMVRIALQESRELSRLLRPPVLDDLGLAVALSWLARTLEERTGLQVELDLDLNLDTCGERLDPQIETLVFRLIQEALTNILKHAGVDRAHVAVRHAGESIELRVTDHGRGFDSQAVLAGGGGGGGPTASSGLRGMRDRIDLFGGLLEITSQPGHGTLVSASVPLTEIVS